MNKEEKKLALSEAEGIVPQLRFPEFKEEWKIDKLGKLAKNLSNKRIPITSNLREKGDIPYYGATGVIDYVKDFIFDEELLLISEDGANLLDRNYPIAYSISGKTWVNNHAHVLKFLNKSTEILVQKYINSKSVEEYLTGKAQPKLNKNNLERIIISLPKNPKEQQKIAACLSSLDEVITAETEKLDLLQDHKKGLLQQLFPAEGETQPKYRFPEFNVDGDWEIDNFSSYIKLYRGSSPRPISQYTTKDENGVNWIKIGDTKNANGFKISAVEEKITALGAKKSRKVKRGELILANSMSYGATYELDLEGCIYDGWFVLREFEESFDKNFLLQLLNSDYLQSQYKRLAAGGIVQNISSEIVYATLLPKPSIQEQQKIADCLSAADEMIAAQVQKIEALQEHKKGLLQQLFPNLIELAV